MMNDPRNGGRRQMDPNMRGGRNQQYLNQSQLPGPIPSIGNTPHQLVATAFAT